MPLTVWLMQVGVDVLHSHPYQPQTLGKGEPLHASLKAEVTGRRAFCSPKYCQEHFDPRGYVYNFQKPHDALSVGVPASRYRGNYREFPESLPPIIYAPGDELPKVETDARVCFCGPGLSVGKALRGHQGALRPATVDGAFEIFFSHQKVAQVDLNHPDAET